MTEGRLLGVGFRFIGVIVMIGSEALQGPTTNLLALMAVLAAAIFYPISGVYGRRFKVMGVSPMATATGMMIASSVMLISVVLLIDQPWDLPLPCMASLGALHGLAIPSTALAYIIYFRILETAEATNLLLVAFLLPVSAILLGIGFLNEVLLPKHLVGMALIGMGLAAIDGRLWAKLKSHT
jgi:drug/metabolite transporter (DMT)-like permease